MPLDFFARLRFCSSFNLFLNGSSSWRGGEADQALAWMRGFLQYDPTELCRRSHIGENELKCVGNDEESLKAATLFMDFTSELVFFRLIEMHTS